MRPDNEIIATLLSADPPEDEAGVALCLAAIDVQRTCGIPVNDGVLRDLLPHYLGGDNVDDAVFQRGLAWASRLVPGTDVRMLLLTTRPDGSRVWNAHPGAVTADAQSGRAVHGAVVQLIAGLAMNLVTTEETEQAVWLLQAAARGHPSAARAAAFVGNAMLERGDVTAGSAIIMVVIEHGEPKLAAPAASMLAERLQRAGDLEQASAVLRRLVDMNLPEYLPRAAFTLAGWLIRLGRPEEARQYFRLAAGSEDRDYAAKAAAALGELLERAGDLDGARRAYEQAAASDQELPSSLAALRLGYLLKQLGDEENAIAAFQHARSWRYPEVFGAASYHLGGLLWERRNVEAARAAFEDAFRSGDENMIGRAAFALGGLSLACGYYEAAADSFAQAIDASAPEDDKVLPRATLELAKVLHAHREQYPRLLREAPERAAEYAVFGLAAMLEQHDVDAAKDACELAIASGRSRPARQGTAVLARLLRVYEDIPNSKQALALVRAARAASSRH